MLLRGLTAQNQAGMGFTRYAEVKIRPVNRERSRDRRERRWARMTVANPVARREWRVLRRHVGDWRLWLGLRWSLDPVAWGLPVVLASMLAPYVLESVASTIRQLWPDLQLPGPTDLSWMVMLALWIYAPLISLVLAATAVTQERERQTWDQLCLTRLTGGERAYGYLLGRLAPLWASLIACSAVWWLLSPVVAPMGVSSWSPDLCRADLLTGSAVSLLLAMAAGFSGLFASARAKNSRVAITMGMLRLCQSALLLAIMGPILVLFCVIQGTEFPPVAGLGTVAAGLWYGWLLPGRWLAIQRLLTEP
jgi:hypothetical protein